MRPVRRKSDGRRIFTADFKRKQIDRVWRGELTLAELSRKLGIARSLLHRWKRLMPQEADTPGRAPVRAVPPSDLRAAAYIRDLQVLLGKQTVELELLRAELDSLQEGTKPPERVRPMTGPTVGRSGSEMVQAGGAE